ncbi:unnamed protein product [Symbiodinium sp. CCMP2456]|nr:unnamed protein product [Symbiodinium sp. CCMP2456]
MKHCSKGLQRVSGRSVKDKTAASQREAETPQKRVRAQSSIEMSPAAPQDGELVDWGLLQPIQKSDDEEEVLPKQKSKEFEKAEKNEKNPPKSKKGRRDGQKLDMKKLLLTEGTQAEPAKSVTQESEASSFAAQPAQTIAAVPAPGSADYNEAVQNLLGVLGSHVSKEQVEYSLSRYIEQGMDLTQAADQAFTDLVEGQAEDGSLREHRFGRAQADAAVDEGSEEEDEQLPELDLPEVICAFGCVFVSSFVAVSISELFIPEFLPIPPPETASTEELIPQERRPPIPATPKGWKAL